MRCRLPEGRVARTSQKCRCNFCSLGMEIGCVRWCLSHGKHHNFRSSFRLVCCDMQSSHPPGRLLILSDHLALVLALCKGRSKTFTLLSVLRRIFASGFREGFVSSLRWMPSELNYSDKPRVSRSWQAKLRESKASPLAERRTGGDQRRKRATAGAEVRTGGFWTTTPPFAHADRPSNVAKWIVGRVTLGAKSCEKPRGAMEMSNCAWDVPQRCMRVPAPYWLKTSKSGCLLKRLLCQGDSTLSCFAASCCRDGSLAVIQPLWVQEASRFPPMSERVATTYTCAHPTSNADTSLRRNLSTVHLSQSSPSASFHLPLAFGVLALVPPRVSLNPCWSVVITASEIVVSTRIRDGSVLMELRKLQ